ncbi:hypothetical protein DSM104299_02092 [Baekduia alba]|uniref:hypothetical protein n=1 Tax=Baekduia alba TaxID=2997333 RepID=UPI0023403220|nr:hypothetical protein [Baekduia alba]WCB93379.1 hypothetical protein DSM104299_02092 [Baekduia alba]
MTALALVALTSLTSAGCGSNAPSTTGTAGSTGTGGSTSATDQDKAVKFAECIRNHGVGDFPDPDAKGEFRYGVSVSPAVWRKAVDACKDLQPPGALSSKRSPKEQTASLRFAECIRENGVEDFPDPANGDPLVDTTKIPSSNRPGGMTVLNAAMKKCGSQLGLTTGGQG